MTSLRKKLFLALTAVTMALTIAISWGLVPGPREKADRASVNSYVSNSLEARAFEIQSKILIGASNYFGKQAEEDKAQAERYSEIKSELHQTFAREFLRPFAEDSETVLQDKLAMALLLQEKDLSKDISSKLARKELVRDQKAPEEQAELNAIVATAYDCVRDNRRGKKCGVSDNDKSILKEQLGWFGKVYEAVLASPDEKDAAVTAYVSDTQYTFQKFAVVATLGGLFLLISLVSFAVISFKLVTGRLQYQYRDEGMDSAYSLEVFCFYLLAMLGGNYLLGKALNHFPSIDPLYGNLVIICSMPLLLFWPKLSSVVSGAEIRRRVGLVSKGFFGNVRDILLAPLTYAAAWTGLFIILLVYAGILVKLGVDIAQGTHPIVPVLLSSEDSKTFILVAVLAVIVAPIVEEIMFRGVLYSWLRTHMGAGLAIVLSAILFAVVHPQGPVGVVPLAVIGMVLAFLREWRGSLLAPMIAHGCFNGGTMLLLWLVYQ